MYMPAQKRLKRNVDDHDDDFEYKKHLNIQKLQNFRFKLWFIVPENKMVPLGFSPLT